VKLHSPGVFECVIVLSLVAAGGLSIGAVFGGAAGWIVAGSLAGLFVLSHVRIECDQDAPSPDGGDSVSDPRDR